MKKIALGLTDIAIPSVPYERDKISDDNYEKSIVFFGKNTLDSGNPNSMPTINQIFEKEPKQLSEKEKAMKRKRFLKIKSLKKMASSDERDLKIIQRLKDDFKKIESVVETDLTQKIAKGSLERKLSLYKRGGKIWRFVYKIAADNGISSVFTEINSYFDTNIGKVLPTVSLFNSSGKINLAAIIKPEFSSLAKEHLFDQIFYNILVDKSGNPIVNSDGVILPDTSPEELTRVRQQKAEIVADIVSKDTFYSESGTYKISFIDDASSSIGDLADLPRNLRELIDNNRSLPEANIPDNLKPQVPKGSKVKINPIENLEKIYQSLLSSIITNRKFEVRIGEVNKNKAQLESLKSQTFDVSSANSSLFSEKYKEFLRKLHSIETPDNLEEIKAGLSAMEEKVTSYSEVFAKELVKNKIVTNGISQQDVLSGDLPKLKTKVQDIIKSSLFNPDNLKGRNLVAQYELLSKRFASSPPAETTSGGEKGTRKGKKKVTTSPDAATTSEVATPQPEPKPSKMESVFSTEADPAAALPPESPATSNLPSESVTKENLAKISKLESYISQLETEISNRKLVDSKKIKKSIDQYKSVIDDFKSGKRHFDSSKFEEIKAKNSRIEEVFKYISGVYEKSADAGIEIDGSLSTPETIKEKILKYRKFSDEAILGLKDYDYEKLYQEHKELEDKINDFVQNQELKKLEERKAAADAAEGEAAALKEEAIQAEIKAKEAAKLKDFEVALQEIQRAKELSEKSAKLVEEARQEQLRIIKDTVELEEKKQREAIERQRAGFESESQALKEDARKAKEFAAELQEELRQSKDNIQSLKEEGESAAARYSEIESKLRDLESRVAVDPEIIRLEIGEGRAGGTGEAGASPHLHATTPGRLVGAKNFFVALGLFATVVVLGLKANDISSESEIEDFINGIIEASRKTSLYNPDEFSDAAFKSIKDNNNSYFDKYKQDLESQFTDSLISVGFTKQKEESTALSSGKSLSIFERGIAVRDTPIFGEEGFTVEGREGRLDVAISAVISLIIELMQRAYEDEKKEYYSPKYSPASPSPAKEGGPEDKKLSVTTFDPESIPENETPNIPLLSGSAPSGWDSYEKRVRDAGYDIPIAEGRFGLRSAWECAYKTMRGYDNSYQSYVRYVTSVYGSDHDPELLFKSLSSICAAITTGKERQISNRGGPDATPSSPIVSPGGVRPISSVGATGELTRGKYYYIEGDEVSSIIDPIKNMLSKKGGGKASSLKMVISPIYQDSVPKNPRVLRKAPFIIQKISVRYGPINPFEINYLYDTPDFISIIKILLSEENIGKIKIA